MKSFTAFSTPLKFDLYKFCRKFTCILDTSVVVAAAVAVVVISSSAAAEVAAAAVHWFTISLYSEYYYNA